MKQRFLIVLLSVMLIFGGVTVSNAQQQSATNVAVIVSVVEGADAISVIMPVEDAQAMYDRLAKKTEMTPLEQRWMAALVISLGTLPQFDTYLDCSGLSYSERMRMEMGSRLEASKCVRRPVKKN